VTTGIDPTYAALGVLTTGALGSVLYRFDGSIIHRSMHLHLQLFFRSTRSNVFSYAVQDENFASSATSLAQGAVQALERNDIVNAATNALDGAMDSAINKATSAFAKIGSDQALAKISKVMPHWMKDNQPDWLTYDDPDYLEQWNDDHLYKDPSILSNPLSDFELDYGLYDYNPGPPQPPPTNDPPSPTYQTEFETGIGVNAPLTAGGFYSDYLDPQTDSQGSLRHSEQDQATRPEAHLEVSREDSVESRRTTATPNSSSFPHAIPEDVQFFEPSLEVPSPSVPYVSYQDEHNPWLFLQSGQSTDHLYRSLF